MGFELIKKKKELFGYCRGEQQRLLHKFGMIIMKYFQSANFNNRNSLPLYRRYG